MRSATNAWKSTIPSLSCAPDAARALSATRPGRQVAPCSPAESLSGVRLRPGNIRVQQLRTRRSAKSFPEETLQSPAADFRALAIAAFNRSLRVFLQNGTIVNEQLAQFGYFRRMDLEYEALYAPISDVFD